MSIQSLDDIKRLRRKYHLSQKELAERSGVSQSLIAKVEAGKMEPTFNRAKLILEALEALRNTSEQKANEIMNSKVSFANGTDSIKEVIKIMKHKGISQMPVLFKEKVCGLISESAILNKMVDNPTRVSALRALDVMEEVPPIVSSNTGLRTVSELLRDSPIVLVAEKGDIKGIISKTDLLGRME